MLMCGFSISTFHSYSRKWTLEDPFVEGGEGVVVLGARVGSRLGPI